METLGKWDPERKGYAYQMEMTHAEGCPALDEAKAGRCSYVEGTVDFRHWVH